MKFGEKTGQWINFCGDAGCTHRLLVVDEDLSEIIQMLVSLFKKVEK